MERDKRKFKRFDAYMSVKFTGTESTSVKGIGLSRDLCREGLKINSDKSLQEGISLDLEIAIPDDPADRNGWILVGRQSWSPHRGQSSLLQDERLQQAGAAHYEHSRFGSN